MFKYWLIGPAVAPHHNGGRHTTEAFDIQVEERKAICPAGKENTQCSRSEEQATGKVTYRFEWSMPCAECPFRERCVGRSRSNGPWSWANITARYKRGGRNKRRRPLPGN